METAHAEGLNERQRQAMCHGAAPLLIVAGAGTGKTRTLVHRVAHLISEGVNPSRILLLTFSRRASSEMLRRVDAILLRPNQSAGTNVHTNVGNRIWGGTFHAVAARLLRLHGKAIGLSPGFTIHDRSDSADLLDVIRTEQGLAKADKRFPKKGTCMAIYSRAVNSQVPLKDLLANAYPWCLEYVEPLKGLFEAYVDRKEVCSVLDYDDLLLFWHGMLSDAVTGEQIRARFDCLLVDEYQDTNRLQFEIIRLLRPQGTGLTVVGDDAQSIYSFRAATVRNILDFPAQFPDTTVITIEQNYRSTQPILAAANAVIAQAGERYVKNLWSTRESSFKPALITCQDEVEQAEYIVRQVLEQREHGLNLRQQAVLFRASHHSIVLEAELARHNIPFVKFGGLKFVEAAHIKDLLALLRLAENPLDLVAGMRVLQLLPGVGPQRSRQLMDAVFAAHGDVRVWYSSKQPTGSEEFWPKLLNLLERLIAIGDKELATQLHLAIEFYRPLLLELYDTTEARLRDLEQLELLANRFENRAKMLAELTLDPPTSTEDFAGPPLLDEDFLVLSTIHSAKGLEWDSVFVIHAADGNIPADLATNNAEEIEEECRLFYVALTRAKQSLHVCFPQRYYHASRGRMHDNYSYAQLTRFIPSSIRHHFENRCAGPESPLDEPRVDSNTSIPAEVRRRIRALWH
jgi:DNA helicase-2/ATP-dependent DNA helicase PcrA